METLKSDKLKKAMAVVLIAFFVMSVTAATVSARPGYNNHARNVGQIKNTVDTNIQNNIAIAVTPVITTSVVVSVGSPGDIIANTGVDVSALIAQSNSH